VRVGGDKKERTQLMRDIDGRWSPDLDWIERDAAHGAGGMFFFFSLVGGGVRGAALRERGFHRGKWADPNHRSWCCCWVIWRAGEFYGGVFKSKTGVLICFAWRAWGAILLALPGAVGGPALSILAIKLASGASLLLLAIGIVCAGGVKIKKVVSQRTTCGGRARWRWVMALWMLMLVWSSPGCLPSWRLTWSTGHRGGGAAQFCRFFGGSRFFLLRSTVFWGPDHRGAGTAHKSGDAGGGEGTGMIRPLTGPQAARRQRTLFDRGQSLRARGKSGGRRWAAQSRWAGRARRWRVDRPRIDTQLTLYC